MPFSESLKRKVRRRAHLQCCLCKAVGVECHHVVPDAEGGADTEDNAAPLCPSCHETYGANPTKRKFIREARDLWYEICAARYAGDADKLDEIKELLTGRMVSYERLMKFKDELLAEIRESPRSERREDEVSEAMDELFDKIWYNRHWNLRGKIEKGKEMVDPDVWAGALKSAERVEKRYGLEELGPWDDFEWGMLNGKLSALRWMFGDEWDMLDT